MKELNLGEIIPINITFTLADLFVTHPHVVLEDVSVHVDGLVFPINFVVADMKGDTSGLIILGRPIEKALLDLEIDELSLKFNNENWCLILMNRHRIQMIWKHATRLKTKVSRTEK